MSYIGNTNTTQAFTPAIDYFSGTGSATAFTLSKPVASVAQVQVVVNNVAQNPSSAYSVSSNTITFTSAPSSGTNNIYVYYTSPITQVIQPGQNTVSTSSLTSTFVLPVASGGTGVSASTGSGSVVLGTSPTLTSPTINSPTIGGTPVMGASVITSGTAVASTSGTSIDFTGIPSWVKRITVMFSNVSTNGNSSFLMQIGSGSITSTGYLSLSVYTGLGTGYTALTTTGFILMHGTAAEAHSGTYTICLISGTTYVYSGVHVWTAGGTYAAYSGGNSSALSGALDRVRITTVLGTDTFDLGTINILYE